jgi:hypothetical protein
MFLKSVLIERGRVFFTRFGRAFSTQLRHVLPKYFRLTLLVEELLDLMLSLMIKLLTLLVKYLLSK